MTRDTLITLADITTTPQEIKLKGKGKLLEIRLDPGLMFFVYCIPQRFPNPRRIFGSEKASWFRLGQQAAEVFRNVAEV
jgi:hypothetical protein